MAMDTATKRASAIHPGLLALRLLPVPDGTVGQPDRQHVAGFYGAILAAGTVAPTVFDDLTTVFVPYLAALRAAHGGNDDTSSLVMAAQPGVRNATFSTDDLNTAYDEYLTPLF